MKTIIILLITFILVFNHQASAAEKIIDVVGEIDADVIVMGTRISSSVGQFFTGSTVNKVMLNSKNTFNYPIK